MRSLTTKKLNVILKNNSVTKRYFLGTFPACLYPNSDYNVYSFITNTDEHDRPGEHWNGWFVKDNKIIFFDSFGRAPDNPSFPQYYHNIIEKFDEVEFTRSRIQGWTSNTCGYFCTHFIYVLSLGLNIGNFIDEYFNVFEINDIVVYDFVKSIT